MCMMQLVSIWTVEIYVVFSYRSNNQRSFINVNDLVIYICFIVNETAIFLWRSINILGKNSNKLILIF